MSFIFRTWGGLSLTEAHQRPTRCDPQLSSHGGTYETNGREASQEADIIS